MSINLRVLIFYMSSFNTPLDFMGEREPFTSGRDTYASRFSKQSGSPAIWVWIQEDLFDTKRIEKTYMKGQTDEKAAIT